MELWWREGLVYVSRGVLAGACLALAITAASIPAAVFVFLLAAFLALGFALTHRPSLVRSARQADLQAALRNQLATAVEILGGSITTQLAGHQLSATAGLVADLPAARALPRSTVRARNHAIAAGLALVVAVTAILVVASRPTTREAPTPSTSTTEAAAGGGAATPVSSAETIAPRDLQQTRARSRVEQAALARLAEQLRNTAAAREIGKALERGDVAEASAQLDQLARDSDQLSQSAKQELAGALLNASKGTTALDKNLAAAELVATQAMTRSNYQSARSALQALAAAVRDSQTGIISQQQLVAQIQQLERDAAAQTGGNGADCGVLTDDGEFFQDCSAVGQMPSSGAMGVVSRGTGQSPAAGVGEVAGGHGFATSGVDLDPLGQTQTHLDLPAIDIPVDLSASNANGNGTTADDRAPTLAISQSSQSGAQQSAGSQSQSTQPIEVAAERSLISPADRVRVREFFEPTDGARP